MNENRYSGVAEANAQGCAFAHPIFKPQVKKIQCMEPNMRTWYVKCIIHLIYEYAKEMYIKLTEILLMKGEGNGHILRRFCTYFKMRRNCTYSKKVLYIFSINAKDLRRCEGCAKEIYTPLCSHPQTWSFSSLSDPARVHKHLPGLQPRGFVDSLYQEIRLA